MSYLFLQYFVLCGYCTLTNIHLFTTFLKKYSMHIYFNHLSAPILLRVNKLFYEAKQGMAPITYLPVGAPLSSNQLFCIVDINNLSG